MPEISRRAFARVIASLSIAAAFSCPLSLENAKAYPNAPGRSITAPRLEYRNAVHYAAVREEVPMKDLGAACSGAWKEVFGWLAARKVKRTGPPLIRYLVINMPGRLEVDFGIPVATAVTGDHHIVAGTMPPGRYAVATHWGPYSELVEANGALQSWAKRKGVRWQTRPEAKGTAWAGRAEFYPTDPARQPDARKWETDLVYLTAPRESL